MLGFLWNHDTSWTVATWVNLLLIIHVKIIWFLKMNGLLSDTASHFFVMWLWTGLLKVNDQTHYNWCWVLLRWSTPALKTQWCSSCFTSPSATSGGKLTSSPAPSPVEGVSDELIQYSHFLLFPVIEWFEFTKNIRSSYLCFTIWCIWLILISQ